MSEGNEFLPKILKIKIEKWLAIALPLSVIKVGSGIFFDSQHSLIVATTSFA